MPRSISVDTNSMAVNPTPYYNEARDDERNCDDAGCCEALARTPDRAGSGVVSDVSVPCTSQWFHDRFLPRTVVALAVSQFLYLYLYW